MKKKHKIQTFVKTAARKTAARSEKYFEAVGRRKTAVARVRVFADSNNARIDINNKPLKEYFALSKYQDIVRAPISASPAKNNFRISVKANGGGLNAQAEAIRLGIARALILFNPDLRPTLKTLGYLRRDPRMVERKKFGLRKARRPQQWRKR